MPAHTLLRNRLVLGAALLALAPGCAVEHFESDTALGASSGGGAAFVPASRPIQRPPAAIPAPPPQPAPSAGVINARPGADITITAAAGEVMTLAPPNHGRLAISGSGVRYTPTPGYVGNDQFSLSLAGTRQTVTVSIVPASP